MSTLNTDAEQGSPTMRKTITTIGAGIIAAAAVISLGTHAQAATATLTPSNCGKVTHNADGTLSPIICPNGHPNAKVWASIKRGTPHMAKLGAHPTWKQVKAATCADLKQASNPIVIDSYQWLATRYVWLKAGLPGAESFSTKVVNGLCG